MIKQTQAGHKHKHYNDDGGAAKGSGRLYRRKRRRIIDVISIPFSIIAIIWILIQVQYHLNNRIANKRMRNKATMEDMKKAFRGELVGQRKETGGDLGGDNDIDIDNVDVDALRERDIQNRQQQKPGYGNNDPDKKRNRWIDLRQLPPIDNNPEWFKKYLVDPSQVQHERSDFKVEYHKQQLWWEKDADAAGDKPPIADYTKMDYVYPEPIFTPERGGSYPPLEPMKQLFEKWPQENIDSPPLPFIEKLQHFDFSDPQQMEAAIRYRDLEFPFKVTNIPELDAAREKWTDEYLSYHFDRSNSSIRGKYSARKAKELFGDMVSSNGKAQYSIDSFFAFYVSKSWNVDTMGPPPTMDTDLSFEKWAKHARYADAVGLASNEVHYYWQSGVSKEERHQSRSSWSMISNDLPSFSDPKANFFGFNPQEQKGIQCRFGERGVTAATHYDGGRNMVGMITGAKRYILSPPNECPNLGVVTKKGHPVYRHSLLNFGHISFLDNTEDDEIADMPDSEREWLNKSKDALAIDTILKAGEVLYIPSHWFHYIVSLQKSAQCNVRSGRHIEGSPEFGGESDVRQCMD